MFIVYILYSTAFDKYYIGQTNNMDNRLYLHNSGNVQSTKPYIPWKIALTIKKESRKEAMSLERKLKNLNRKRLHSFIKKYK